ncbi:carbon-phosphorus lyase complex subunit PhnI [Burkholderia oklahomensis]|uniref:carbon-phosphorus lyase complex subunit PhnI n=1 Tax=Burkholderia oklahomensis TaxID=342113 RepID=UPI00016A868C|nr:carbon-phosphorus lyase complex subunit PhnI [Burkholderia oklahomensis]AJX34660.1 bacterial phosphonate metabolism family protein [Burkholderia oklahomensis C6786]AOI48006.1 carbon-phosphorus lyase complex subunit PhnI [Burkholderia oklahomensis C6786]KUY50124.1 carbon-phosphorus lyase complex subunit PhnI [Burkholderia oklahomensis C6786]MBI0363883.1 carbon-phosphorus lyase complex subunit PhnI [Burkholderia oklahomensis]SUY28010.1 Bacterial phosphonate metabolism protein (PhnI) [Burkhold
MYVAVKGGEKAILQSYRMLDQYRRGDPAIPELTIAQIVAQMPLAVSRVMAEGSLYDRHLAALAIKQAAGDLIEAIFLLRAYRTTLPRFAYAEPIDTARMAVSRRISSTFKDVPGGQLLGPTYDYTQRLLDFSLEAARDPADARSGGVSASDAEAFPKPAAAAVATTATTPQMPGIASLLERDGLIERDAPAPGDPAPADLTREAMQLPADRAIRLQNLARADEGFLLSMGYSTQRGYGNTHPFVAEIRFGGVEVEMDVPELGFAVTVGEIDVTECQMVNGFGGSAERAPCFTRGYGLAFGYSERKAMAMALVDRSMRAVELGESAESPANDEEFVLYHSDNVEASGFVQHLKLPHHVDFQAQLELLRQLHAERAHASAADAPSDAPAEPEPSGASTRHANTNTNADAIANTDADADTDADAIATNGVSA